MIYFLIVAELVSVTAALDPAHNANVHASTPDNRRSFKISAEEWRSINIDAAAQPRNTRMPGTHDSGLMRREGTSLLEGPELTTIPVALLKKLLIDEEKTHLEELGLGSGSIAQLGGNKAVTAHFGEASQAPHHTGTMHFGIHEADDEGTMPERNDAAISGGDGGGGAAGGGAPDAAGGGAPDAAHGGAPDAAHGGAPGSSKVTLGGASGGARDFEHIFHTGGNVVDPGPQHMDRPLQELEAETEDFNCEDLNEDCHSWSKIGECENNKPFMMHSCRTSCGVCGARGEPKLKAMEKLESKAFPSWFHTGHPPTGKELKFEYQSAVGRDGFEMNPFQPGSEFFGPFKLDYHDHTLHLEDWNLNIMSDVHKAGTGNLIVGHHHNFKELANSVIMGEQNKGVGDYVFVAGKDNYAHGTGATIIGGEHNKARNHGVISGGTHNLADGAYSLVSGGKYNKDHGEASTITGGSDNTISNSSLYGAIHGGSENEVEASWGTINGGSNGMVWAENMTETIIGGKDFGWTTPAPPGDIDADAVPGEEGNRGY